jgi:YgiT-type zinc finger domain-containing protein
MNCSVCTATDLATGQATLTFERGGTTVVVKRVPALVCPNCGEEHISEETAARAHLRQPSGLPVADPRWQYCSTRPRE